MSFTLKRKTETVTIEHEDGTPHEYQVRELNGREMEAYLDASKNKVIMHDGKVVGMKSFEDLYVKLLAATLYDEDGRLVEVPVLRLWPATLQKDLFDVAQQLNGLKVEEVTDLGNS